MANDTQSGHSSGGKLDPGEGTSNSGTRKVDTLGLRGSKRDSSSGQITSSPSSTRRSERLEKRIPPETPLGQRKSKRLEQQNSPNPLRRSDRCRTQGSSTHFGSKSSEKASSSAERQKKKDKKEKSIEQLTMDAVEVSLGENRDHEAVGLKRKKLTARTYKALFMKQRKSVSEPDSDDKLERPDMLPQIDSFDSRASGSQPMEHWENGSLGCGLRVKETSFEGTPSATASSLKDFNVKVSREDVEPELAYASQSLSDKPPCPDGADLGGSLIGCTNRESVDDVNKDSNDHSSSGILQIPELVGSTSLQRGDISLEIGHQFVQSERESCASCPTVDVSRVVVNKDASTQVEKASPLAAASTEHENANFNGNGAVCSNRNLVKLKENFVANGGKPDSSKFVEYWVPVPVSNLQLEQYCATLLNNAITLCSPLKKDGVGALQDILMTVRKCCNHPYIVDSSLQHSIMKGLPGNDIWNVGIKASGKLELLDIILSKIRRRKLRVLILFQTIAGSAEISIGNILDDFLRQRFGEKSYERIDACLPPAKKQDAINRFNNKGGEQFVLLLEHRACSSSIKLLSVDIVIIFDTEFNPSNDIKDLQRMSIDSHGEQIKVFRLYSCYTLEEKVLIFVKHHKNVQNNLQSANRTISDVLLMWGASVLFNRLDKYHAEQSSVSSADISSGQQWLLDDIVKNFMAKILNNSKNNCEQDSIISRAFLSEGVYHTDGLLLGEKEVQLTDGDERQIFWKKLLEGRNPRWKFLGGPTPRSRKRVLLEENHEIATKHQKVVDTRDTAPTCQPELEGRGQSAVSKAATNLSEPLPVSVACPLVEPNKDTNLLPCKNSLSHESHVAHLEPITPSDERRSLHTFLRAEMEKLCVVLKLSMDVKHTVGTFLEYVMENHHVNKEPASILQAFQISLCWIAASILKEKIDRGDSLMLAKKVLNFQCTEEEAYSVYVKLRSLRKTFLQLPRNISVSIPSQNVSSVSEDIRKQPQLQPPYAGHPSSASFDLRTVKVEVEERSSSLEPLEEHTIDELNGNYADRKIKKLQKKCDEHIFQPHKQHKEILEFHKMKEQEKLQLEGEHQLESAFIRTTYPENAMRMDMLKILDSEFKKKIQEHESLMEIGLKDLQARHSAEMEQKKKKVDDSLAKMISCTASLGPGKEVSSAGPDVEEQNADRIVHDYGTKDVIFSDISVTAGHDVVGSVLPETSLHTPVNPVLDEGLEIERADAASVTVVEQPKETSQNPEKEVPSIGPDVEPNPDRMVHDHGARNAGDEFLGGVLPETSLLTTVNPVLDEPLEIEREDAASVTVVEQAKETSQNPEKEVPSAGPDVEKNPDRIAYDYGARNVTSPVISVTIGDDAVGSVVPETSSCTPVNPVVDVAMALEIVQADAASVMVVEQHKETSRGSHQIETIIAQEAVACNLHTATSPNLLNSTSGMMLDTAAETSPVIIAEQLKEVHCLPHTDQDITPKVSCRDMVETGSIDLATSKEQNAYEILSGSQNNEIPSGVPCTVGSEIHSASTSEMDASLELETGDGGGNSVGSDAMGNQKDLAHSSISETVPSPKLPSADVISVPITPIKELPQEHVYENTGKLQPTSDCSPHDCNQMIEGSVELAVSHNGEAVALPPSTEGMDSGHIRDGHVELNNCLPTSVASLQMVDGSMELSLEAVSQNGETVVLPPQMVEVPVELSHEGVSQNGGPMVLSPSTERLDSGHVHDSHVEGGNSSSTSASSLQMVEGSGELSHQAVSQNRETVVLPSSTGGMDSGNSCNSHVEGGSSLPTAAVSPRMVEGSLELSHHAISLNGEITGLPPSAVGIGSIHFDNHSDLEVGNGTDSGPNIELSAASQNPLASMRLVENIIRHPNQVLLQSEPNLAIAEGPTYLPVLQMHRISYRNPTLSSHAEPLQIELETIREDMEQTVKLYDSTKSWLKSECEKEIEETITQIQSKYEAKLKEAESAFLLKKTELDLNHKKVFMNHILAEAFRSKCLDLRTPGNSAMKQAAPPSFIQHMHPLSLQPRLRHPSAATFSSAGQPAASQQTAISPLHSLHRSSGLSASVPARPPQINAITGGEIRSQTPHLQPFRPRSCTSAASTSSLPCNVPGQQLPTNLPTSPSPPSLLAQRPSPSLPSQFLLKPKPPSQPPAVHPLIRTNQDVSSNQPSETQNGVHPGRHNLALSAMELLMGVDDQAGGHLPNILQHLAGSGLNTTASHPSVSRASCNANEGLPISATASDVVCLSDDDG